MQLGYVGLMSIPRTQVATLGELGSHRLGLLSDFRQRSEVDNAAQYNENTCLLMFWGDVASDFCRTFVGLLSDFCFTSVSPTGRCTASDVTACLAAVARARSSSVTLM